MSRFARAFYTLFLLAPAGLPFAIAHLHGHHQCWAILVLNLISLGFLFAAVPVADRPEMVEVAGMMVIVALFGWLAALVWSATAVRRTQVDARALGLGAVEVALSR
jgi:hypothetical protein